MKIESLDWEEQEVADGAPLTTLVRLPAGPPGRAFTVLIRFPVGWSRPFTGYYEAAEELLVLEGELHMSGSRYGAGDYAWFPAGYLRSESSSPGALVLAWFSGPARWHRSPQRPSSYVPEDLVVRRAGEGDTVTSPLGPARLLRAGVRYSTFMLADVAPVGTSEGTYLELFGLSEPMWATSGPGERTPAIGGEVFCRLTMVEHFDDSG